MKVVLNIIASVEQVRLELPAAGLGILNYELYLTRLSKSYPNIPIIIEHLDESDIPRAKKFVDDTLKIVGGIR